jgi:UPF0271 protein
MNYVLDASVFFVDLPLEDHVYTTPSVVGELVDFCAKCRYEALLASGLLIQQPSTESVARVKDAAKKTGDISVLSATDRDIIGLALDLMATLVTDDYAVQNVAHELGVDVRPIQMRRARTVAWRFRCSGCGRYYRHTGICQVCGAEIKRKIK